MRATWRGSSHDDPAMLEDILDGLFDIAKADGAVHERELAYLARVGELFGFDEHAFARIRARHVIEEGGDPYLVLQRRSDLGLCNGCGGNTGGWSWKTIPTG